MDGRAGRQILICECGNVGRGTLSMETEMLQLVVFKKIELRTSCLPHRLFMGNSHGLLAPVSHWLQTFSIACVHVYATVLLGTLMICMIRMLPPYPFLMLVSAVQWFPLL